MSQLVITDTLVDERFILAAIKGCRLSKRSVHKMDSRLVNGLHGASDGSTQWQSYCVIGPEDERFVRARILGDNDAERKLLRAIPFSVFITGPLRFWFDLDTYKIATVKQSSSLMHYFKSAGELRPDDFTPTTDSRLIAIANEKFRAWLAVGGKATSDCIEWEEFQDAIGRGVLYTAQWEGSYATLRNMYFQRRHHRQGEFHQLCDWVRTLPASWMITLEKASDGQDSE